MHPGFHLRQSQIVPEGDPGNPDAIPAFCGFDTCGGEGVREVAGKIERQDGLPLNIGDVR